MIRNRATVRTEGAAPDGRSHSNSARPWKMRGATKIAPGCDCLNPCKSGAAAKRLRHSLESHIGEREGGGLSKGGTEGRKKAWMRRPSRRGNFVPYFDLGLDYDLSKKGKKVPSCKNQSMCCSGQRVRGNQGGAESPSTGGEAGNGAAADGVQFKRDNNFCQITELGRREEADSAPVSSSVYRFTPEKEENDHLPLPFSITNASCNSYSFNLAAEVSKFLL